MVSQSPRFGTEPANAAGASNAMSPYEHIVADLARRVRCRVAGMIVRSLQRMTEDLTSGDSRLANVWDEVCVQVQLEESVLWFAYEETVRALAKSQMQRLAAFELQALWLQTEPGIEWSCSTEGEEGMPPTNADDVVDGLMTEVWSVACDWSNSRIRAHLRDADRVD